MVSKQIFIFIFILIIYLFLKLKEEDACSSRGKKKGRQGRKEER